MSKQGQPESSYTFEVGTTREVHTVSSYKKTTCYICIAAALAAGFLGGVSYSVIYGPETLEERRDPDNQLGETIQALQQKVENNPDDAGAWARLGHAFFDIDEPSGAIDAYQNALALRPEDTAVMTDLGVMYRRNNQPQKAIDLFDQVLMLEPHHEQARFNKGVVLLEDMGNKEEAISTWKSLVARNPETTAPSGELLTDIIARLEGETDDKK
ncbi:MAG: hypothetical protein CSA32_05205 [Desulfobulbus propionicus]|nr:MAG: hypothetical protein CSA32_05205 [Desulfobulbus propionicus]